MGERGGEVKLNTPVFESCISMSIPIRAVVKTTGSFFKLPNHTKVYVSSRFHRH